ncbi:MAG: MBL fold metallo-hydrolase [Cyclobacteriaceae bacterium]
MKNLLIVLLVIPTLTFAQRDWDAIEIKTNELTDNISWLEGSGGNIGVIHGNEGIMIIDDQFAELSEKISQALSSLSDGELKFIVNTHFHGDHTGGNENLSANGALIVAHQNVRERLGTTFFSDIRNSDVASKPASFWPTITFSEEATFYFNDEEIQIIHLPAAHTDGDAMIFFKTSNILHTGDAFVRYGYPFIDTPAGGSIDGIIAAQEAILKVADSETKIIPGHGQLSSIQDVAELLQMLKTTRRIVAQLKQDGKSLDEAMTARPLASYHERWSGSFIDSDMFVRLIYESID